MYKNKYKTLDWHEWAFGSIDYWYVLYCRVVWTFGQLNRLCVFFLMLKNGHELQWVCRNSDDKEQICQMGLQNGKTELASEFISQSIAEQEHHDQK